MVTVTHAHVATGTDAGTGEVHKDEWNGAHVIAGTFFDTGGPVSVVPDMWADSWLGYTSSASETYVASHPWESFVGSPGTGWHGWLSNGSSLPQWLRIQLPDPVVVITYAIMPWWVDNYPSRTPKTWTFEGSNDASSWSVLDTRTNFTSWTSSTSFNLFTLTNGTAYRYYRLNISANQGDTYTGVGALRIYAAAVSGALGSSGLDLLEQHTASSSATLDFTTAISTDYDEYLVEFLEVAPASNAVSLGMQVSTDGGSTWDTTSGHYYYNNNRIVTSLANASSSTTSVQIAHNVSNSVSGLYVTGSIRIRPTGTNQRWAIGQVHYLPDSSDRCINFVNGDYENGTYNAIRFLFSSGSIASGTIRIYGLRKTGSLSAATNENAASTLVNATSTGDAGSRADHFPGTSLGGAWTSEGAAWGQGPTVKYSSVGLRATGTSLISRAYTPSGACRVEARIMATVTGFGVKTSDAGDAGDGVLVWWGTGSFESYTLDSGSYTLRTTLANGPSTQYQNNYYYVALERDGSNNWTTYMSLDRALWRVIDGPRSKTFTAAKIYVKLQNLGVAAVDFVDVTS